MEFPADSPLLRIGELSRRLGVSDHVLRGWTNRYGLLQLQRNGWRIGYLGAGAPAEELERAAGASHPGLVVLAATRAETLEPLRPQFGSLARRVPLALAGAGVTAQIATAAGARLIAGDPVTEVERAGWSR
jgi:methanogenic corrinoid protein MtbC1